MRPYQSLLPDRGWIDSASLYQVVDFFDQIDKHPAGYPWSFRTVIEITTLFLFTDHQSIAASSQRIAPQDDIQSRLNQRLVEFGIVKPRPNSSDAAVTSARSQFMAQFTQPEITRALRKTLVSFDSDVSFQHWLEWAINSGALTTHLGTHGSVVDRDTSETVGIALDLSKSDLDTLLKVASNPVQIRSLDYQCAETWQRQLMLAYAGSALLRGLFHRLLAEHSNEQLTPHPMRDAFLQASTKSVQSSPAISISNTSEAFARLIIALAIRQRSTPERLVRWVENIRRARIVISESWGYLVEAHLDRSVSKSVEDISRRANLLFAGKELVMAIDWTVGYALNKFTALQVDSTLNPVLGQEPGFAVGASLAATANATGVAERIANRLSFALSDDIKHCGKGVVRRIWTEEGRKVQ